MKISQQTLADNIVLVQCSGRLDGSSSNQLRDALADVLQRGQQKLIVDLINVPFIDSSGLVALVSALRIAREKQGSIILTGLQPQALVVFRLTMLDHVFNIYSTPRQARHSYN